VHKRGTHGLPPSPHGGQRSRTTVRALASYFKAPRHSGACRKATSPFRSIFLICPLAVLARFFFQGGFSARFFSSEATFVGALSAPPRSSSSFETLFDGLVAPASCAWSAMQNRPSQPREM